jgi:phage shock protein C
LTTEASWPDNRAVMPLYRSRKDRVLGGVCGGIAEWLGWNSTTVRILYVLVSILSAAFPGTLVYVILWIIAPESDS